MSSMPEAGGGFNWGDLGGAVGDIFSGIGGLSEAGGLSDAADLARKNAKLVERATQIEEIRQTRQIYQAVGGQQADIAAAGFSLSGSAIDLMKSSMQQGSLDKALIANQGEIEKNSYLAQAGAYEAQAGASEAGGFMDLVSAGIQIAAIAAV